MISSFSFFFLSFAILNQFFQYFKTSYSLCISSNKYKWSEITNLTHTCQDLIWNCIIGLCFSADESEKKRNRAHTPPPSACLFMRTANLLLLLFEFFPMYSLIHERDLFILSFFFAFVHNFLFIMFYFLCWKKKIKLWSDLEKCTLPIPRKEP